MRGAPGGRGGRVGLVVVVVSLIVIVGSFLLRPDGPDSGSASDARASDPATTESSASPTAEPTKRRKRPAATPSDASGGPEGLPGGGGSFPPLDGPAGFGGTGGGVSLKKQNIHLQVFSSQPIGVIGYQVPTSLDKPSGTVSGVGTSWSLRTVAYGKPDYARLFFRAGPSGAAITCVITVNGRVTERRSTSGPYGATMCQG